MADETTFVTIELNKKQVLTDNLVHNEKTGKDYARVIAPGGGNFFYPIESIKVRADNPDRVYFSRPEGTELNVSYKNPDASDDAPNEEKYYTKTWKIEDLKEAYEAERRAYAENHGFVNMEVPTGWGKHFQSENGNFVSISIPIAENENVTYYSFVMAADKFKESTRNAGMSYFGFPKKQMDSTEDYMVKLKTSIKKEPWEPIPGDYIESFRTISSTDLKTYVDKAVQRSAVKDLFVSTRVSEKLVRGFYSKEGKSLFSVSVPVVEESGETAFYEIVVPSERVNAIPDSNLVQLSLFKNGLDGTAYNHTAKKSVPDGNGGYDYITISMTSEDVISRFEESRKNYLADHADHSLADEMAQGASHRQNAGR